VAAVRGCLPREMPESDLVLQLLLVSGGHLEFVVARQLDLPVLGAIV
jgi:hypothetical protein